MILVAIAVGVGLVLVTIAIIAIYKLAERAGRPPLATTTRHGAGPFALPIPALPIDGPVEVWLRYDVAFPFVRPLGQKTHRRFCLLLDLVVDGQTFSYGHGGHQPSGLLEVEGISQNNTSFRPGDAGTPTRYAASVMVKKLARCPRALHGSVAAADGTVIAEATISLRR